MRNLFRSKIEPACAYCSFGTAGEDDKVICPKHGVMDPWQHCHSFSYDPLRREPEPAPPLPVDDEDADYSL